MDLENSTQKTGKIDCTGSCPDRAIRFFTDRTQDSVANMPALFYSDLPALRFDSSGAAASKSSVRDVQLLFASGNSYNKVRVTEQRTIITIF